MKKLAVLFVFICLTSLAYADSWIQKASLPVMNGLVFSIANKGYCGFGVNGETWEFDPVLNTWTQKANFTGNLYNSSTCGFSINNKGYILLHTYVSNFWEFDPILNQWTSKPNFPGSKRIFTPTFSINNEGYIVGGANDTNQTYECLTDLWAFNSSTNSWYSKASLPGGPRFAAIAFSNNNYGYFGLGYHYAYGTDDDFWQYDPLLDAWSQKASCGDSLQYAYSFSIANRGFVGISDWSGDLLLQYDPANNQWLPKTGLGVSRFMLQSFSIGLKGYVGGGSWMGGAQFNDLWEYTPDSITGIEDVGYEKFDIKVVPNPATYFINVSQSISQQISGVKKITITNESGSIIYTTQLESLEVLIDIRHFTKGMYMVKVDDGKKIIVRKFLKN